VVEIWLSANGKQIRLPVLPEKITLEAGGQHEKVTLHEAGEVLLTGKRTLKSLSISSYFPARYTSLCSYMNIPDPKTAADALRAWAEGGTVAQLVIAGGAVDVNMPVVIESFSTSMRKIQGDIEYEMALTEYRRLDVVTAQASVFKLHPRPTVKPNPPKPRNKRYKAPKTNTKPVPIPITKIISRYGGVSQRLELDR
jgi:hypothetical protein